MPNASKGKPQDEETPAWLKSLAKHVGLLVRKNDVRLRFQKMIKRWVRRRTAELKDLHQWEAKRRKYFEKLTRLPRDDVLRAKADKPPKPGWKYDEGLVTENIGPEPDLVSRLKAAESRKAARAILCEAKLKIKELRAVADALREEEVGEEEGGRKKQHRKELVEYIMERTVDCRVPWQRIWGWVPPTLQTEAEPVAKFFLPLSHTALMLDEKYALLAAVHDVVLLAIPKINPWPTKGKQTWAQMMKIMPYAVLTHCAIENITGHEAELRIFFSDVKADLRAVTAAASPTETGSKELGERPSPEEPLPDNHPRCAPMSKAEMARRLCDNQNARPRDIKATLAKQKLRSEGGNKWTIRLDGLDTKSRARMEKPMG